MRKNRIKIWIIYSAILILLTCLARYEGVVSMLFFDIFRAVCAIITMICVASCELDVFQNYKKIKLYLKKFVGKKQVVLVYCIKNQRKFLKNKLEEFALEVEFVENKKEADIILTDKITAKEKTNFQRLAYTPLAMVTPKGVNISEARKEISNLFQQRGYGKRIVYCPKKDSEGGMNFYDYLLIVYNKGKYPEKGEEMEKVKKRVEKFLSQPSICMVNMKQWLQKKKELKPNEICLGYEKDFVRMENCNITQLERNVLYKLYYQNNNKELDFIKEKPLGEELSYEQELLYIQGYRLDDKILPGLQKNLYYVEVPLED